MVNLLKFIVFVISFFTYFSSIVYATSVTVTGYVEREREAGMFFYYLNSQTNGKIFLGSENEFTDDTNKQCIMDSFKNDKVITLEGILQKDGDDKSFVDSKFSCTNVNDQKYIKVNDQKNENLPKIKLFDINFDMNYNDVIENGLKKGYIVAATDIIPKYKSELKKLDELIALNLPRILPYTNMNDKILQEVKEFNSNPDLYNKNNELGFDGICYHKAGINAFCAYFLKIKNERKLICMETVDENEDFYKFMTAALEDIYGHPINTGIYKNIDSIWRSANDVLILYHMNWHNMGPIFAYSIPLINIYTDTVSKLLNK